jgi:hypothetical protein
VKDDCFKGASTSPPAAPPPPVAVECVCQHDAGTLLPQHLDTETLPKLRRAGQRSFASTPKLLTHCKKLLFNASASMLHGRGGPPRTADAHTDTALVAEQQRQGLAPQHVAVLLPG